jgi:serine/threonine protein kinase
MSLSPGVIADSILGRTVANVKHTFENVIYNKQSTNLVLKAGMLYVTKVLEDFPPRDPILMIDMSHIVMHCDPVANDATQGRVTLQPWKAVLLASSSKSTEPELMWRFTFQRPESQRFSFIAMSEGIVQIAFNEVWRITKFAGSGGFADVYMAQGPRKLNGAVKISRRQFSGDDIETAGRSWKKLQKETECLRNLQDIAEMPRLYGMFMMRARDGQKCTTTLCMVMQYFPFSLSAMRKSRCFTELEMRPLLLDILGGVAHMHSRDYVHRDLKISNVMLESSAGAAYLIDFGFADKTENARSGSIAGTAGYLAPELFRNGPLDLKKADVFSLGCLMLNLVSLSPAFPGRTVDEVLSVNRKGHVDCSNVPLGKEGRLLLESMVSVDPAPRPELWSAVRSNFFTQPGEDLYGTLDEGSDRYELQLRGMETVRVEGESGGQDIDLSQLPGGIEEEIGLRLHKDAYPPRKIGRQDPKSEPNIPQLFENLPVEPVMSGKDTRDRRKGWADMLHVGILESLQKVAGKAKSSFSGISRGFELTMRSSQYQSASLEDVDPRNEVQSPKASKDRKGTLSMTTAGSSGAGSSGASVGGISSPVWRASKEKEVRRRDPESWNAPLESDWPARPVVPSEPNRSRRHNRPHRRLSQKESSPETSPDEYESPPPPEMHWRSRTSKNQERGDSRSVRGEGLDRDPDPRWYAQLQDDREGMDHGGRDPRHARYSTGGPYRRGNESAPVPPGFRNDRLDYGHSAPVDAHFENRSLWSLEGRSNGDHRRHEDRSRPREAELPPISPGR